MKPNPLRVVANAQAIDRRSRVAGCAWGIVAVVAIALFLLGLNVLHGIAINQAPQIYREQPSN